MIGGYLTASGSGGSDRCVAQITLNDNTVVAAGFYANHTGSVAVAGVHSPAATTAQTYKVRWQDSNDGDSGNDALYANSTYPLVLKATEID